MDNFKNDLQAQIAGYSTDDLIALASINAAHYRQETIDLAKAELFSRGVTPLEQQIHFDLIVDSGECAGRFIQLGEELMFLSTGMSRSIRFAFNIFGIRLKRRPHNSLRFVAAQKLNLAALANDGSWSCSLSQINYCEFGSSWLAGGIMNISGVDENANPFARTIENGLTPRKEFDRAARQLQTAILKKRQEKS